MMERSPRAPVFPFDRTPRDCGHFGVIGERQLDVFHLEETLILLHKRIFWRASGSGREHPHQDLPALR